MRELDSGHPFRSPGVGLDRPPVPSRFGIDSQLACLGLPLVSADLSLSRQYRAERTAPPVLTRCSYSTGNLVCSISAQHLKTSHQRRRDLENCVEAKICLRLPCL